MFVQYVEAQSSNGVKQLCRLNSPIKAKPVSSTFQLQHIEAVRSTCECLCFSVNAHSVWTPTFGVERNPWNNGFLFLHNEALV